MTEKVKKSKTNKIIKIITNVLFYFVIVFLLAFSFITISGAKSNKVPSVFGYGFLAVKTDSMIGTKEGSFDPGSLIIVKTLTQSQQKKLTIGDVITFYDYRLKSLNTHRIVDIDVDENGNVTKFITRGDKYDVEEHRNGQDLEYWNDPIKESVEALAMYQSKVNKLGGVILWVQTEVGFAVVVVLPIFIMFLFQGVLLIRNIYRDKNLQTLTKYEQEKEEMLQQERERIRQELLKELNEEKENNQK